MCYLQGWRWVLKTWKLILMRTIGMPSAHTWTGTEIQKLFIIRKNPTEIWISVKIWKTSILQILVHKTVISYTDGTHREGTKNQTELKFLGWGHATEKGRISGSMSQCLGGGGGGGVDGDQGERGNIEWGVLLAWGWNRVWHLVHTERCVGAQSPISPLTLLSGPRSAGPC